MPLYPLAEIEGDGLAAVFDRPPLGKIADELDVLVVLDEAIEYLVVDLPDEVSFAMTGFSLLASPMELSTKVFGFRSAFCTAGGKKEKK